MTGVTATREGAASKHELLRDALTELCRSELSPGDQLPSERELCEQHSVSRTTVRDAVGHLVSDGLLVRVPGKGTFVAERQIRSRLHLASFHQDMRRLGHIPSTVVFSAELALPPPATTSALGLRARDRAVHVRRLLRADATPIGLDDAWYHAGELPGLLDHDLSASIYDTIDQRYDKRLDRAEQTVRAVAADEVVATLVGIEPGSPVFLFDRISFHGDTPLEHTRSWYRSDRYELQMSLGI